MELCGGEAVRTNEWLGMIDSMTLKKPKKFKDGRVYLVRREWAGWAILRYRKKRWHELHQTHYGTATTIHSFECRGTDKVYELP